MTLRKWRENFTKNSTILGDTLRPYLYIIYRYVYDDTTRARINGPKKSINERYRPTYKKWLAEDATMWKMRHTFYMSGARMTKMKIVCAAGEHHYTLLYICIIYKNTFGIKKKY